MPFDTGAFPAANLDIGLSNNCVFIEQTLSNLGNACFSSNVQINGTLSVLNIEYEYSNIIVYSSEIIQSNLTVKNTFSNLGNVYLASNIAVAPKHFQSNSISWDSNGVSSFVQTPWAATYYQGTPTTLINYVGSTTTASNGTFNIYPTTGVGSNTSNGTAVFPNQIASIKLTPMSGQSNPITSQVVSVSASNKIVSCVAYQIAPTGLLGALQVNYLPSVPIMYDLTGW